jgi:ABC-2 type transport system ATP-binding protein
MADFAVEIENLEHVYPPSRRALAGLSFRVRPGEIFGLFGPNGGGKTTLFRILSTALRPSGGRARVFGADAAEEPARVREKIGVVFQHPSLDKKLTVRENLMHQGHLYGLRGEELRRRSEELLSAFGVADRAGDKVEVLSGGLQRRVEAAKGLLHKPALLLLDEPSAGLDPAARRDLWKGLRALKAGGVTVLLTTHLMEEAEACDRLALLDRGRLVAEGTPEDLRKSIGGDVIIVRAREPEDLREKITAAFGGPVHSADGVLRLERPEGHAFIPKLVEAFPGRVDSVTLGKPTLEDVFIRLTGRGFAEGGEK